jgi:hypothetical protein
MKTRARYLTIDWMPEGFTTAEMLALPQQMQWTPDMVRHRLLEAARVIEIITARPGPRGSITQWPEAVREWGDAGRPSAPFVSRRQVARAEEAMRWPGLYLEEEPGAGRVLRVYLRSRAYRESFSRAVKSKRWSRATAYRMRDRALSIIALCLMRDGVRP